jgi:hypothetical protein
MVCTKDCRRPTPHQAHCSVCHKTFNGYTTFDLHRVGGKCVVVLTLKPNNGVWGNWDQNFYRGPR